MVELLDAAEHQFEVLITMDQIVGGQQGLRLYDLAVILLDTARMVPAIESVLSIRDRAGAYFTA